MTAAEQHVHACASTCQHAQCCTVLHAALRHSHLLCRFLARVWLDLDPLRNVQAVWSHYDPRGRGYLGTHQLVAFLQQLQAPLGHRAAPPAWLRPVRYECWAVRKPHRGLPFADVLTVLLHHRLGMGVRP